MQLYPHTGYYDDRTVTGRRLPKLVSQAELRKRALELAQLRQQYAINPAAVCKKRTHLEESPLPQFAMFFKGGPVYVHTSHDSRKAVLPETVWRRLHILGRRWHHRSSDDDWILV